MKANLAISLSMFLVVLFMGTVGAFLFYVPALPVFAVATVLAGLGLMFALGLMAGRYSRKLPMWTHPAEVR